MNRYSTSNQLIKNTKNFLKIKHYTFLDKLFGRCGVFYGWGRKESGLKAIELAKKMDTSFVLLEDGFIRSKGLGVDGSPSFSLVEDNVGIYYDATVPSRLENILNTYDFTSDVKLMDDARRAIELLVEHNVSKYNNAPEMDSRFRIKYGMTAGVILIPGSSPRMTAGVIPDSTTVIPDFDRESKKVLIIAQTAGDASLEYGMLDDHTTDNMIDSAISENPDAKVYLKVHPDVLSGKKKSDIDMESAKKKCIIIEENINPISLLKHFDKVYTKTSGMGFEALLVGCECVCFGMPFYAGWGVTDDRSVIPSLTTHVIPNLIGNLRRGRKLSVEEIFAAAYILYTRYHNPYTNKPSDIFDTIETIVKMRFPFSLE